MDRGYSSRGNDIPAVTTEQGRALQKQCPALSLHVPTDFPLHLIHCLCEGLEQEIESAALFLPVVLDQRIAKGIQIAEFFSGIQKKFRYVSWILARIVTAGKNDFAVICEFLAKIRFEYRQASRIGFDS